MPEHPEYQSASVSEFEVVVDLDSWRGRLVHVEGWTKGSQFKYLKTIGGVHLLRTPKYNKMYRTRNRLLKTRGTA